MSRRQLFLAVLALIAISSTWMLMHLSGTGGAGKPDGKLTPDYYMEDFTTLSMDADGHPKNRLYAVYMAHYQDDDTSELLRPRLEFYRPVRSPLLVQADKGWVTENAQVILLNGNVALTEHDPDGDPLLEVRTEQVRILPEQGYAETDAYATIRTTRATVTGTGMRVDLAAGRLQVLKNVRTIIEHR